MDMELCMQFRDKVNENDLVYHIYRNRDGKDQWSIICSAMDWIEVVADSIDSSALSLKNDNASSVKLMTFVVCIDVLWEAVQQLHRVFIDSNTVPFEDDNSVFEKKQFPMRDNQYFKTIRACFATHPINLNDHFTDNKQKERRYAGWSSGGLGDGDFSVPLYSNIPGEEAIFFDIRISELMGFAQKRYITWLYLPMTQEEVDRALQRSGIADSADAQLWLEHSQLPDEVNVLLDMEHESLAALNALAQAAGTLSTDDIKKLGAVVTLAKPQNAEQVKNLAENLDLFDFAPGAHSSAEYGKYMIQQSGHYDFDENLDEFYDYEGYALQRMNDEDGMFTDRGYIAYKGHISLEEVMENCQGDSMEMGGMV